MLRAKHRSTSKSKGVSNAHEGPTILISGIFNIVLDQLSTALLSACGEVASQCSLSSKHTETHQELVKEICEKSCRYRSSNVCVPALNVPMHVVGNISCFYWYINNYILM